MLKIKNFTVQNLAEGCVTDESHPSFSFSLESDRKNVSLHRAELSVNGWRIETERQVGIIYEGQPLKPFTVYTALLKVQDNTGEKAQAEAVFETGRLGMPWKAQWITDGEYHFREKKVSPKPMTFYKSFTCGKKIRSARLYATAWGIYEFFMNGEKVGRDYFAPGFTSYKNQLQYQTYDVTSQLKEKNELSAVVAGGWAVGVYTFLRRNRIFANRQALLAELRITYEDGSEEIISTGSDWKVSMEGNYKEAEFYVGETYDAACDLTKSKWRNAFIEKPKLEPELLAQYGEPVRAHEELEPVSVKILENGRLLYDFGQNLAGVVCAKINGRYGQKIVFRHAEILMDGALYVKPLRSAKQEAVYFCKAGKQEYSPRMTYMGFRYVEVEGIEEKDLELTVLALYSAVKTIGTFLCSNEMVNRLQNNIVWSAKSNFVDIPTDCPQRDERLGWTGDIALFGRTAAYNFDMSRFFEKWLKDVRSEQKPGGGIPLIVPHVTVPSQMELVVTMAVDHWGDACILVPWALYRSRGDIRILKEMYPVMKKYIKACCFWAKLFSFGKHKYIWKLLHHYGDWCAPGTGLYGWMERGKWTATACLSNSSKIVSEIAKLLGYEEEAAYYGKISRRTADAYRSILLDSQCKVKKEFQTAYVLPLYYEMLGEADKKKTAENLARLIREDDYHIGTGFPGTPYVLFALADNGYVEEAYKMLLKDSCPSWLYEIKAGATTIWERWDALREDGTCNTGENDGTGGMVSFNHYAGGAVGDFLYRRVLGIEELEGGYQSFQIAPIPGGGLTWVKGILETSYGTIGCEWNYDGGNFCIKVKVPVGTSCELTMPGGRKEVLGSGEYEFTEKVFRQEA